MVNFTMKREPTIRDLSSLVNLAKEGASEVDLVCMLGSLLLEPRMSYEELLNLPVAEYAGLKEATAKFQSEIKSAVGWVRNYPPTF